jgi:hypothetical protein
MTEQRILTSPQPRPLRQILPAGAAVIGFALVGATVLYLVTEGLLLLRADISGRPYQAFTNPQ